MDEKIILKSINDLLGEHFYIPHYQRGYRWTEHQVNDLLNDIWSFANKPKDKPTEFYCLQPVVVKKKQWIEENISIDGYEVVDGQQRLTSIYIILNYLAKEFLKVETLKEEYAKEVYSLRYETRVASEEFLKNIEPDRSNIDFYHISAAYEAVKEWFTNGNTVKDRTDKNKFLDTLLGKKGDERSVQIIWYVADQEVNSVELFTRLNMGKIPLTNAELIKALFLASSSFNGESKEDAIRMKIEISQIWDEIEQKLNEEDEHFWSFVTNNNRESYSTKIELLFDLIAKKSKHQFDPLYTFLYFMNESKNSGIRLWDVWLSVEKYYLTLCEWYSDKDLYHKVGYLISIGKDLSELIDLSMGIKKDMFDLELDKWIQKSIKFEKDLEDLNYNNDHGEIERLLLLFNVESIRSNKSVTEFYPFKFHKGTAWSLEHIHAQNSESLGKTKREPWIVWIKAHASLIKELIEEGQEMVNGKNLIEIMHGIEKLDFEKLTWEKFNSLSEEIILVFSENSEGSHSLGMHSISNLALLSRSTNSALNNAVFEVKRREIIRMDKEGCYIPLCTRRVFLKYYNDRPSTQQHYFWSRDDRENYLLEIKNVLKTKESITNEILN